MLVFQILKQVLYRVTRTHIRTLLLATLALIFFGSVGIYFTEHPRNESFHTFGDCLWWAVVTMSTVGYGDKVPITAGGRVIGFVIMAGGPILLVSFMGSIGALFYDEWRKAMKGKSKIKLENHLVICGWSPKAKDIIAELRLSPKFCKYPITIIDDKVDSKPVEDSSTFFVYGNPCEVSILEQANVQEAKFAIVLAADGSPAADQKTVLTVLAIEDINPSILTCAELNDLSNEGHLRRAGCDVVINTNALTSKLLAMSLENPTVNKVIKELVTRVRGNEIYRVKSPQKYIEKPFKEPFQELKSSHNMITIGLERGGECLINPPSDFIVQADDFFLVISEQTPSIEL